MHLKTMCPSGKIFLTLTKCVCLHYQKTEVQQVGSTGYPKSIRIVFKPVSKISLYLMRTERFLGELIFLRSQFLGWLSMYEGANL